MRSRRACRYNLPLLAMSDPTNLASLADRVIESLAQPSAPPPAVVEAALRHEAPYEAHAAPLLTECAAEQNRASREFTQRR